MSVEIDDKRARAVKRLEDKRAFEMHLVSYVLINAFLVLVWAITGRAFFWPLFVIGAWGIGLLIHAYVLYRGGFPTEEEIKKEMEKLP